MHKTMNTFQIVVKDGVIQQIGRSSITQPAAGKKSKTQVKKCFQLKQ